MKKKHCFITWILTGCLILGGLTEHIQPEGSVKADSFFTKYRKPERLPQGGKRLKGAFCQGTQKSTESGEWSIKDPL